MQNPETQMKINHSNTQGIKEKKKFKKLKKKQHKKPDLNQSKKSEILTKLEQELLDKNLIKNPLNRNLFNQIEVLGFDVDHTLGIYNITTLTELLYTSFTKYLIKFKNYPENLNVFDPEISKRNSSLENFDFLTVENCFELSGVELLADLNNGVISRIGTNGEILKATYGLKILSEKEIEDFYPNKKIPDAYNFHFENYRNKDYIYLQGYFENHMTSLLSFCIELSRRNIFFNDNLEYNKENLEKNGKNIYKKIVEDIYESLNFNYVSKEGPMQDYGYFYPEIFKNPKKYLVEHSATETLKEMKKFGVRIFYATNSPKEFGDLIMRNSFGEDFLEYFDLAVSFAKKPKFFKENLILNNNENQLNDLKFIFPNCSLERYKNKNKEILVEEYLNDNELHEEIKIHKGIICNNFETVKIFYQKIFDKKEINYIYVGDSLVNDGVAPVLHGKIKSICIIDEIDSHYHGIKPENLGTKWLLEKHLDNEQYYKSHAREHSEFSVSNVQSLGLFLN